MYYSSMEKESNPIKNKCIDILKSKKVYVKSEAKYLLYMMRDITQEDLAEALNSLTMRELKLAIYAGVPGDCHRLAMQLLADYKKKLEAYLEADGNKAHMSLESLDGE